MFRSVFGAAAFVVSTMMPASVWAQACCAGAGVVTPARLGMHDDALLGIQAKAAMIVGSFDNDAHFRSPAPETSEYGFEQALFGAIRVFENAQLSILVPVVETRRATRTASEFGGGIGDLNLGVRYDLTLAGRSQSIPGIGILGGLSLPTGVPPERASSPLATDSTGIGAFQGTIGFAIEQTFGPWLINLSGLVSKRTSRSVNEIRQTLGLQATVLGSVAYAFENDAALAVSASYTLEDSATINDAEAPATARHLALVSVLGLWPISDRLRIQGSLFLNPPLSPLGRNQPAAGGLTFALVRSWS